MAGEVCHGRLAGAGFEPAEGEARGNACHQPRMTGVAVVPKQPCCPSHTVFYA